MTVQSEQIAHAELVGGGETALHSHSGGGGVTTDYIESDGQSNTTSTSWQTKLTYTVSTAGTYLVQWNFELYGSSTSYHTRSRVLHNSAEIANIQFEPEDISPEYWLNGSGFKRLALSVGDTIQIQYCSESTTGTASIRYARIFLLKV